MIRADPDRLYWNVSGHVTCGQHAPRMGTDTWDWEQWEMVPADDLAAWRGQLDEDMMECEVCKRHDGRETG